MKCKKSYPSKIFDIPMIIPDIQTYYLLKYFCNSWFSFSNVSPFLRYQVNQRRQNSLSHSVIVSSLLFHDFRRTSQKAHVFACWWFPTLFPPLSLSAPSTSVSSNSANAGLSAQTRTAFLMRLRISIRGLVRPSIRRSVRPSRVIFRRLLGASCAVYPALLP